MSSDPLGRLRRFLRELKRRNVYKVAVTYVAVAFVGFQAARLLIPSTVLPSWSDEFFLFFLIIGFPVAVVVAWAFEMTPEGVRRTPETEESAVETDGEQGGTRRAVQILAALGLIAVAGAGVWQFTPLGGGDESASAATPRIAVLPFENIARDSGDAFFARGMHEEVLNQLAKVSGLEVISRTSVMQYAETDMTVREISRELDGVNAVLEGTVRRAGERLRITVQLIKVPEDEHLWSKTYRRRLSVDAVFRIQSEIATRIAEELRTQLTDAEKARIREAPTGDLTAYNAFLRGRSQWWRWARTFEERYLARAAEDFREAVRRDSSFATARAWLATAQASRFQDSGKERWLDSARAALERAQSVGEEMAQAEIAEGYIQFLTGSHAAAEQAIRRALQLEPSNALAAAGMAAVVGSQGEPVKAVRWTARAVRLDPRRPFVLHQHAFQLTPVGLLDPAEQWLRQALAVDPDYTNAVELLARVQVFRGTPQEGSRTLRDFLDRHPGQVELLDTAGWVALVNERPKKARQYLTRFREARRDASSVQRRNPALTPEERLWLGLAKMRLGEEERGRNLIRATADSLRGTSSARGRARLAAALGLLGEEKEALEQLQAAVRRGFENALLLKSDPLYHPLQPNRRFQAILDRLEARKEKIRKKIRQLGIDLYPAGEEPDSAVSQSQSND